MGMGNRRNRGFGVAWPNFRKAAIIFITMVKSKSRQPKRLVLKKPAAKPTSIKLMVASPEFQAALGSPNILLNPMVPEELAAIRRTVYAYLL